MKKNVAGQYIGAQLTNKTDGSPVTGGTTTVSIVGNGGSSAAGAGTVTYKANGYWQYAPTQAETNYDHVAFTFTNSAAITTTVQTFPETGGAGSDPWATLLPGSYGAGTAGNILGSRLDVAVSSRSTFAGGAVASVTGNVGGNVVGSVGSVSGNVSGSVGSVTGAVGSVTSPVTVGTNTDKTGYSLSQSFPSNFASLAITAGGAVTAGTVSDKTGYSLTQAFPANFAALAITASTGRVTVGTNADKTGYSLTQTFPANFGSLAITAAGKVTVGTNDDKSGYTVSGGTIATVGTVTNPVTAGTVTDKTGYNVTSGKIDEVTETSIAHFISHPVVVGTNMDKDGYGLNSGAVTAILNAAISQPTTRPNWNSATLGNLVGWVAAVSLNKITQTATTQTLRNAADSGNIATATVSDDGTTFTKGAWS